MLRSETAATPERRATALAGLRAFQQAARPPERAAKPAIARAGRATLRDYGGSGPAVVFVPSLINPPHVLDLARGNSLLRWLARQGVRPMLVDWGTPDPQDRALDVTGHVEQLLLPLLRALRHRPVLVGYCLGGTMATAAAASIETAGLVQIAAPWHFAGYGDARAGMSDLWDAAFEPCEKLGLVPMEVLQSGFWRLDPRRTVAKFERFAAMRPGGAEARAFVALEDWANEGAPLTFAAGRQLFDDFLVADLPGRGKWEVCGKPVRPEAIAVPMLSFVSTSDRIVPAATAATVGATMRTASGHVGMIIGARARASLWQPLADWLTALPVPR